MDTILLQDTWINRARELAEKERREKLAKYGSALYKILYDELSPKVEEFQERMKECCKTATARNMLNVPIWSYNTRYFTQPCPAVDMDEGARDTAVTLRGYHHCVGSPSSDMPPVPVHVILRDTNVLDRLCADLFGFSYFYLRTKNVSTSVDTDLEVEIVTRSIYLCFYPNGLPYPEGKRLAESAHSENPPALEGARLYRGGGVPFTPPRLTTEPPHLPPPPPVRRQVACYCGCDDD